MAQPVIHFEIAGPDSGALKKFYSEAFGWAIDDDNPVNYGMVSADGDGIGGGIGQEDAPLVTFYVAVPDPAAALEKLVALGAKVVMPPQDVPGDPTIARFADPAGNVIGLVKPQ